VALAQLSKCSADRFRCADDERVELAAGLARCRGSAAASAGAVAWYDYFNTT
jgi:hypothetical protein